MHQVARQGMLIALCGFTNLQIAHSRQPRSTKHPADGALRHAQAGRDARLREPSAAQRHNRKRLGLSNAARAVVRSRAPIRQAGLALRQVATEPFTYRRLTHAVQSYSLHSAGSLFNDRSDHLQSTCKGQSGILMNVHSAELLKDAGWVAPPSLSNSVRMNSNNCGFNRSMQQIDEIVQLVFRSLKSSSGVH